MRPLDGQRDSELDQLDAPPGAYALVVGANAGGRGQARLRYAERDAARMAELLGDLGGFPAGNDSGGPNSESGVTST